MTEVAAEPKRSYPYVSANVWTELRSRFQKSVPSKVTPGYLQTALGFESEKAAKNLLPQLRQLGLIEADDTPTELAKRFRMDDDYAAAAQEIVAATYPEEVRELFPGPDEDVASVAGWFMRHTGGGQASAQMQARLYVSLVSGKVPAAGEKTTRQARAAATPTNPKPAKQAKSTSAKDVPPPAAEQKPPLAPPPGKSLPDVHIDLQIHIDADATPEQIDAVFASMAKHLYGRE